MPKAITAITITVITDAKLQLSTKKAPVITRGFFAARKELAYVGVLQPGC